MAETYFRPALFSFLDELAANNDRAWFQANKDRYESHIKTAAIRFIRDFGSRLGRISPHFRADPRPVGGSLFRIYRDTRFAKDKSPYKTHVGIHFKHESAKDVHSPGFYLHLEPSGCFIGGGIWHPDGKTLAKIRTGLDEHPDKWKKATSRPAFRRDFKLEGDTLKRAPRGYADDHPLIDELKRKDFIAVAPLSRKDVTGSDFMNRFGERCRTCAPFVRFLCEAVDVPY